MIIACLVLWLRSCQIIFAASPTCSNKAPTVASSHFLDMADLVIHGLHTCTAINMVGRHSMYNCISKNEMNRDLGHLCAHIGQTGPREPPEDGEMIEMTLPSRHRIRNLSPGGLRPSTLPLGHRGSPQYWLSHVDGEETFLFLSNRRDREPSPEL